MKIQKHLPVKSILFDFDGTLCDSQPAFTKWHTLARQHLAKVLNVDYETADAHFSRLWREGNHHYYVNPNKLIKHTIKGIKTEYPQLTDRNAKILKEILLNVYTEPVYLYPDAEEIINKLASYKIKIGIVTHASSQWTKKKMQWTKINKFLLAKHPYVVSMNELKDHLSWSSAADHYGIDKLHT